MSVSFLLQGGLGNQLLQVCAGIYTAKNYSYNVNFDSSLLKLLPKKIRLRETEVEFLLDKYKFKPKSVSNLIRYRFFPKNNVLVEQDLNDLVIQRINGKTKLVSGYFHNIEYVDFSWEEIKNNLLKKIDMYPVNEKVSSKYFVIHFRGGDYIDDQKTKNSHGLTQISYYQEAVELLLEIHQINMIYIVTDSPEFANNFFKNLQMPYTIISNSINFQDMKFISNAQGVIMSNSSFSWWGAYLAEKKNQATIIYPKPWFAGNIPDPQYFFRSNWKSLNRFFDK
jgi:hypothetical protein